MQSAIFRVSYSQIYHGWKSDFDSKQLQTQHLVMQLATADLFVVQVEEFVHYLQDKVGHISPIRQLSNTPLVIFRPKPFLEVKSKSKVPKR